MSAWSPPSNPREQRSDAARNHEALVRAATAAVHREGPRVPMATIAADAGVGIGTLYRHFPTREDLLGYLTHVPSSRCSRTPRPPNATARPPATRSGASSKPRSPSATSSCCRCTAGPPARERTRAVRDQVHRAVQRIIERGRADGTITRT